MGRGAGRGAMRGASAAVGNIVSRVQEEHVEEGAGAQGLAGWRRGAARVGQAAVSSTSWG